MAASDISIDRPLTPGDASFFGHPRGLATLFFTEMWERFSFYGMRALLILFMVASASKGGLALNDSKAGAIYGLYTSMIYLASVPGGWIADKLIGQRKAVLYGGIIIALGHFSMVLPGMPGFWIGLSLIVMGTGLLKPNISTIVGQLYAPDDSRRDAGFSIFYMGVNLGALISPIICGYLGEEINWHYGFGAAGVGMTLGVIQYVMGSRHLGDAGIRPAESTPEQLAAHWKSLWSALALTALLALLGVLLTITGVAVITAERLSNYFGVFLTLVVVVVFTWLLMDKGWSPVERKRMSAILLLFLASALFWSVFEQAGSTLNLFGERATDRHWPAFLSGLVQAWHLPDPYPASWFQALNSFFLVLFAPVFAWIWIRMGKRDPSSTAKFAAGLVFVGLGFVVLIPVANKLGVSAMWLTMTYLCHTFGELLLSPVGLSAMTKLAPARVGGFIMGIWFLSISVGDYLGGRAASFYQSMPLPTLFGAVGAFAILIGLLMTLLIKPMRRLMGGVN